MEQDQAVTEDHIGSLSGGHHIATGAGQNDSRARSPEVIVIVAALDETAGAVGKPRGDFAEVCRLILVVDLALVAEDDVLTIRHVDHVVAQSHR